MQENIVETKNCIYCDSSFDITDRDLEFYDKISPVFAWKKYQIPTPTLCPDCRQQRRLSFRNERKLYKGKCISTWKEIISIYSPDKELKNYETKVWWSDKWDTMDYWVEFDFNITFFEQYKKLLITIPVQNIYGFGNEGSEYTNYIWNSKNCYLTVAWVELENIYYSFWLTNSKNIFDSHRIYNSNNLYESIDCDLCNNSLYLDDCQDCNDSIYLKNCIWCSECIWSVGLRNKQYYIWNKSFSKDEYLELKKNISLYEIKTTYKKLIKKHPKKNLILEWSIECKWDYIKNSNKLINCFYCDNVEESKYLSYWFNIKDVFDIDYDSNSSLSYEWLTLYKLTWWAFNNYVNDSSNVFYSSNCFSSKDCFACVWLKNKEYCILNKQYTKQEYEILVPKIIEYMKNTCEWWEFFPSNISPFWYNETVAQEYFPLTKEESLNKWFNWSDYVAPFPEVKKIIPADKLPDNISDIPDDILNRAIECEVTKKPFRIIAQELEFYRKYNLPIPKRHPEQRHLDRMEKRNPRKLFDRKCDKCWIDILTTHLNNKIVYCEECYNKEIY